MSKIVGNIGIEEFKKIMLADMEVFQDNMFHLSPQMFKSFPDWFRLFEAWLEIGTEMEDLYYGKPSKEMHSD